MSEQEPSLEIRQENKNNSVFSERERKNIVVFIKLLSVLIIILVAFIIEALINQHPVFSFLDYYVFEEKSIINGSISIAILFSGILVFGISLGISLLGNCQLNRIIDTVNLIGITLILSSFGLCFKSYNWELGMSKYISFVAISSGCILGFSRILIKDRNLLFSILDLLSFVFCVTGVVLFIK